MRCSRTPRHLGPYDVVGSTFLFGTETLGPMFQAVQGHWQHAPRHGGNPILPSHARTPRVPENLFSRRGLGSTCCTVLQYKSGSTATHLDASRGIWQQPMIHNTPSLRMPGNLLTICNATTNSALRSLARHALRIQHGYVSRSNPKIGRCHSAGQPVRYPVIPQPHAARKRSPPRHASAYRYTISHP